MTSTQQLVAANPALHHFALAAAALSLKMVALSVSASTTRVLTNSFETKEDGGKWATGEKGKPWAQGVIARLNACLTHDTVNNVALLFAGLAYALVAKPDAEVSKRLFATIVGARYAHSLAYLAHLQPWRAVAHFVAYSAGIEAAVRAIGDATAN
ncbi:hypothetical protein BC830DRAFT_309903 [Chytriomyces sp. MP71]|nr:hypothetical protein BC830DRAFT_309903 [Chytriomyces sp. MP71]